MENNVFDGDGILKLIDRWIEKVTMRNPYLFGKEKIDLDDFKDLLQKTFDTIKTVKNEYIFKNIYPDAGDMLRFIALISRLSQYALDDQILCDETENCAFTATVLLAEKLRRYASAFQFDRVDEQVVFSDHEDYLTGDLELKLSDYVYLDEDEEDKICIYNIYDGNFDEILEFAKRVAD